MARDILLTHDCVRNHADADTADNRIELKDDTARRAKINIYDKTLYEIVTVDSFGDRVALAAFKALYGSRSQSLEEFLIALTLAAEHAITHSDVSGKVNTDVMPRALKRRQDGFNDIRDNIANLAEGYAALAKYFPDDELEDIEGFVRLMLRNTNSALQKKYTGFKEKLILIRDKATGNIMGGSNFGIYLGDNPARNNVVTAQDSYVFVAPDYRRIGIAGALSALRFNEARIFAAQCGFDTCDVIAFSEQNSPLKMSAADYARDSAMAIDPVERLKAWRKVGCLRADFTYIQPALGEGQDAVEMLDLHAHIEEPLRSKYAAEGLSADIIKEHLRMFMEVSCLKEEGAFDSNEHCQIMARELDGMDKVALVGGDVAPMQSEIQGFFLLLEEGKIPRPDAKPELYHCTLGQVFAKPEYAILIADRVTRMTPRDVAYITTVLKGHAPKRPDSFSCGEGAGVFSFASGPITSHLVEMAH
jgi:hypothetical protein